MRKNNGKLKEYLKRKKIMKNKRKCKEKILKKMLIINK